MQNNKPVPVCATGVSVHMTPELWRALKDAGHTTVGARAGNRDYVLSGCSATPVTRVPEFYRPRLYAADVISALAERRTIPMPMEFMGYNIRRDHTCGAREVRLGCSRFRTDDVLAVAAASDRMVRRARRARKDVQMTVNSRDTYGRGVLVTVEGDVRYAGYTFPRECLREVARRIGRK